MTHPKINLLRHGWAQVSDIQQTERAQETLSVVYLQCNYVINKANEFWFLSSGLDLASCLPSFQGSVRSTG